MTLLPLAILLLLHIPFVCSSLLSLNGTSVTTLDVSNSSSCIHTRTLWDIIWSCAATLFACTWTAIHPNVPGMDEGKFTIFSRRLGIMMTALIAPELMIIWATVQFLSARDTAKDFDDAFGAQIHQARSDHSDTGESTATLLDEIPTSDGKRAPHVASHNFREWTVTHGFFAWMGGFMLYFEDKPRATLTPEELERFVHEGSVEIPIIAEADIEDRSKGDILSKGIAILQLAWFVLHFVTRYVQNLPITLLEIDTLAVATLTCITYNLWWKKPKDVRRPYAVHWKATYPPSKLAYDNATAHLSCKVWRDYVFFVVYPWGSLLGLGAFISPRAVQERRVPSLGGYDNRRRMIIPFIGCFSVILFGGIHCLGWNVLSLGTQQTLWRAAFLTMVSTVVFVLPFTYAAWLNRDAFVRKSSWHVAMIAGWLIYIIIRVTLIVITILSLQSLPPGAYDTIAWTKFIPHL